MTIVTDHGHIMNQHISKSKFKAKALELLRQVESSGESLIITDHGRPVAEVRPIQAAAADPLAALKGSVLFYDRPMDPVGEEDWEALRSIDEE